MRGGDVGARLVPSGDAPEKRLAPAHPALRCEGGGVRDLLGGGMCVQERGCGALREGCGCGVGGLMLLLGRRLNQEAAGERFRELSRWGG